MIEPDRLVHWLLGSLTLDTTVFHAGQYCGRWRASTGGRSLASFHLVLQGRCWLHRPGHAPLALNPRDGVFLLNDVPHVLSPDAEPIPALAPESQPPPVPMQPLAADAPGNTGLACGFFHFRDAFGALLAGAFPEPVIVRADEEGQQATSALFDLMRREAEGADPDRPSPLLARLTELLFFYVMRRVVGRGDAVQGLWALAGSAQFAPLLERLLAAPGEDWSIERMAAAAHMSRAAFCKHFAQVGGQPPAQFLLQLRMKVAAERLQAGDSIERAADHVGYRSSAAFSRAFAKVLGRQPGLYCRLHQAADGHAAVAGLH